jgi:AcrR family transcriptional regulator
MKTKTTIRKISSKKPATRAMVPESRDLILDAAERLFGDLSFDTVSMRDISGAAGVNLSLVQYYFRTKESLFEKVVARRAGGLGERRLTLLAEVRSERRPGIESIVDAYMRPLFELAISSSEGARSYALVISQVGTSRRWVKLLDKYFGDILRIFVAELRSAIPKMQDERLFLGFNFALSVALSAVSRNMRLEGMSDGKVSASDHATVYPNLVSFIATGLKGLESSNSDYPLLAGKAHKPRN